MLFHLLHLGFKYLNMRTIIKYITIAFLSLFGTLTVFLTISVLLDLFGIRQKEGNFVPFIVWTNLFSGLLYLVAAYGFFKAKFWTTKLLGLNVILLLSGLIGLYFHMKAGGLYEMETVRGMVFRVIFAVFAAISSLYFIKKNISDVKNINIHY